MEFQLDQEQFDTMGQWYAWQLGLDLADPCEAVPPGLAEPQAAALRRGELSLHHYFHDLLTDLYLQPKVYGVPEILFEPSLPEDTAREDRLREARLKVRKAIENGLIDYLYQVGRMSELEESGLDSKLKISRFFYDRQVEEKKKKAKNTAFLKALDRLGMETTVESDTVVLSNPRYPGMLAAMSAFAKECARIKDLDIYFFRRCDLAVLSGKRLPTFDDALRMAPVSLRGEIMELDNLLREHRFKREIFVASGDGGYRFRYAKKGDAIVYWARIRSWTSQAWSHNLRWDIEGKSPVLFARLDAFTPGLAERVYTGIKTCAHCYGPGCIVRIQVQYNGLVKEGCKEAGWNAIGETPADFENLRTVLCLLDEL